MSIWSERFFRAYHDFHRMKMRLISRVGPPLPPGEFFFLERICDGPPGREVGVSELRCQHHMSPPAVSQILSSLERKGLVERSASKADRRQIVVTVTDLGRAMMDEARATMNASMDEIIAQFGADRAQALTELMESLNLIIAGLVKDGKNEVKEP